MLSASIDIIYSVQVVLLVRFAERRNFPFSTSKAAGAEQTYESKTGPKDNNLQEHKIAKCIIIQHIVAATQLSTQNKELIMTT